MRRPACPQNGPYVVMVEQGREYLWCACGLSKSQPWCDGSHEGTAYEPIAFTAPLSAEFHMCGCNARTTSLIALGTAAAITAEPIGRSFRKGRSWRTAEKSTG